MDILRILERPSSTAPVFLEPTIVALPGDLETPVSAYLKLESIGARFLLESAENPKSVGRYTFIGIAPRNRIDIHRESSRITSNGGQLEVKHDKDDAPFTALKRLLGRTSLSNDVPQLGLLGGLVGYADFGTVSFFEPKVEFGSRDGDVLGSFYLVDTLLVFDHHQRKIKVILLSEKDNADAVKKSHEFLEKIESALRGPVGFRRRW